MYVFKYILSVVISSLQSAFLKEAISNLSVDSVCHGQVSATELRKRHANLQERIQGLWNTTNLFNKAICHFEGTYMIMSQR